MAISFFEVAAAGRGPYPLQGLEFLLAEHLFVEENDVPVPFTFDARRQEVTLDNDPAAGATLRIGRTTPIEDADRIVDFLSLPTGIGGLTADLLRTDQRQLNFILGECRDARESGEVLSGMGLNSAGEWDAESLRIEDIAAGMDAMDSARKDQLDALVAGDRNLPAVNAGNNDNVLVVNAGDWAARTPAQGRTHWGLGTVATLDAGTGANNVVQLDSNARYPTADGRNIDLTNHPIQADIALRARATVIRPLVNTYTGGNNLNPALATWSQNSISRMNLSNPSWTNRIELNNSGDLTQQLALSAGTWRVRFHLRVSQSSGGTNWSFRITDDNDTSGQTIFYDLGVVRLHRQINAGQQYWYYFQDELIFKSAAPWSLCFRNALQLSGGTGQHMLSLFFHKISPSV